MLCLDLIASGNFTPDPILFDSTNRKLKIIRGEVKSQSTNNESTQFSSKTDRLILTPLSANSGVSGVNGSYEDLGPYPLGATSSMVRYANFN